MGSHYTNGLASPCQEVKPAPLAKWTIPSGFRMSSSAKELHGNPIYCISWSSDVHENTGRETDSVDHSENKLGVGETGDVDMSSGEGTGIGDNISTNDDSVQNKTSKRDKHRCSYVRCLATCGGNQVTVYEVEIPESKSSSCTDALRLRQAYVDADVKEVYYACAFGGRCLGRPFGYSTREGNNQNEEAPKDPTVLPNEVANPSTNCQDEVSGDNEAPVETRRQLFQEMTQFESFDGPQLLCVAGTRGVIKVVDTVRRMLFMTLSGHGDEIYDMKFSPTNEWLLLSASKDESLRLWNVKTATCVAIFAGHEGHRDSVLSLGWHPLGERFVSAGMDTTVKLWSIEEGTEVSLAIEASSAVRPQAKDTTIGGSDRDEPFRTVYAQMPYFSSNKVHTDYIDCVQFVGDLVLSKSISNTVVLWMPDLSKANHRGNKSIHQRLPNEVIALREFPLSKCDVWFIRFQTDVECQMLAIGNNIGEIRIWEIGPNPTKKYFANLTHQHCSSTVRMVSFSPDAKCIVASCDDATLWKWDAI